MRRTIDPADHQEGAWACLALEVETARDDHLSPERIERLASQIRDVLELELDVVNGHRFEPIGFSLIAFGATGRLAVHTWPEYRCATIDVWLGALWLGPRRLPLTAMLDAEGYHVVTEWLEAPGSSIVEEVFVSSTDSQLSCLRRSQG